MEEQRRKRRVLRLQRPDRRPMRRVAHVTRVFDDPSCERLPIDCCALTKAPPPAVSVRERSAHTCPFSPLFSPQLPSPRRLRSFFRISYSYTDRSMTLPCTATLVKTIARYPPVAKRLVRHTSALKHARSYSSVQRPYRFNVAASWAGKPLDPPGPRVKTTPFSAESAIGRWRNATLARGNQAGAAGMHIGEDFFYIQDVSTFILCAWSICARGA